MGTLQVSLGLQGVTLNFAPKFIFSTVFHTVSFLAAHRLWLVTLLNRLTGPSFPAAEPNLVGSGVTFRSSSLIFEVLGGGGYRLAVLFTGIYFSLADIVSCAKGSCEKKTEQIVTYWWCCCLSRVFAGST